MTRKKIILLLFLLLNLAAAKAQPYIRLGSGYGLGMGKGYLGLNYTLTFPYHSVDEAVYYSLGTGIYYSAGIGYMFNKSIGIDLNLDYHQSHKTSLTTKTPDYFSKTDIYGNMWQLSPSMVLQRAAFGCNIYTRLGFIVGSGTVYEDYYENDMKEDTIETGKFKMNGGIALGSTVNLGIEYPISKGFSAYFDINMKLLSYAPLKGEMIEYRQNGRDVLGEMTTREKKTEYYETLTYNTKNEDPDEPLRTSLRLHSYSCFLMQIGLKFSL